MIASAALLLGCSGWNAVRTAFGAPGSSDDATEAEGTSSSEALPSALKSPPPATSAEHGPIFPPVERVRLPGGGELLMVPQASARLVSLDLVIRAPLRTQQEQRTARWAIEGVLRGANKQRPALRGELETLEVGASAQGVHVHWSVLPERSQDAVEHLFQSLLAPQWTDFATTSWEIEQREHRRLEADNSFLADYLVSAPLENVRVKAPHPALTRPSFAECQRWLGATLRPSRTHLVVVGPVDAEQTKRLVSQQANKWSPAGKEPVNRASTSPPDRRADALRLADKEGTAWAKLRVSFDGPERTSPHPEQVWVHLQWGLRALTDELEKLADRSWAAKPTGTVAVDGDRWRIHLDMDLPAEQVGRIAEGASREVARWTSTWTAEDLERAAHGLRARLRHQLQDPRRLAAELGWLLEQGFDLAELERELAQQTPDPNAVRATWERAHLSADRAVVAIVGDARRLDRSLAGWREVFVFEPKRQLQLARRLPVDPRGSREVPPLASEDSDQEP